MGCPEYLAMTAAEFVTCSPLPSRPGWMGCHFSLYGTGVSGLPDKLPEHSMLILNDRIPIFGHDPLLVAQQLHNCARELNCDCILLDFQRKDHDETSAVIDATLQDPPCPVGVSAAYAQDLDCPALLPPVPLDVPLERYLSAWRGREIWLELARELCLLTLTSDGCIETLLPYCGAADGFADESLHCHYHIKMHTDRAEFTLFRTSEDQRSLLSEAETMGVTRAVGLWQEFSKK